MSEPFWLTDPSVLLSTNTTTNLNVAVKVSAFFAIVMFFLTADVRYFMIPFLVMFVTVCMYNASNATSEHNLKPNEAFDNVLKIPCSKPTEDNPFMNALIGDEPDRARACDISDPQIKTMVSGYYDNKLFRDGDDVFVTGNDRQFYTVPDNNDQNGFAEWLYGSKNKTVYKDGCTSTKKCEPWDGSI